MSILTSYQKKALVYNKHISLTANAGSGKTTVLSKRYVEILVNENIAVNSIVAITFTEKAASELYSKIAKELEDRILNSNPKIKRKLEVLRRSLVSAKISTIHSFCIDILKDYAPEAGIDANFSPIDARTSDELLDQSINEVIVKNLSENSESIKNLIRIFGNKSLLISKIKFLFAKRKTTEKLIEKYYSKKQEDITEWLQNNFEYLFKNLFDEIIENLVEQIIIINSLASSYKVSENQIEINRILNELNSKTVLVEKYILLLELRPKLLTSNGTVKKRGYLSTQLFDENSSVISEVEYSFSELKNIEIQKDYVVLNKELSDFGKSISDFYLDINNRYTNKKQQRSYLDFEDLLLLTQNLLKNEDVKNALTEKYKFIMIDEYQDTNETQYNIFMPILNHLSSGNLFVVGDEKQSIYMFREAEVELFNQTKKQIETKENVSSLLELPHSFRLTPNIALFTNVLFKKLFHKPRAEFNEVKYNNLVCAYPHNEKGKVEIIISQEEEVSENELIAKKIIQLSNKNNENYNFGDITVLCKKRKNFIELEKIFSEYSIPFVIVGGKGFFQQQLILDIYSYLSFLINPQNDLALASILRAPYFGLSDNELMSLSLLKGKNLFNKFEKFSLKGKKYENILNLLKKHLVLKSNSEIHELIRTINTDTGYWAYISAKKNSSQEIANLEKLIQKSIQIVEFGFNTLYDFVVYLHDAINNLEDEGQADFDSGEDSVKVMTIHQSKGLEFKVVILYKTNQMNFDETLKSKELAVDKNFGIQAKLPFKNNYFDDYKSAPIIGVYNYIQKKKSIAEQKRLLYVAITRAEQHLIISAGLKKEKIFRDSFFEMILKTFNINLGDTETELRDELIYMKFVEGEYLTTSEINNLLVNIQYNIDYTGQIKSESDNYFEHDCKINVDGIESNEKNEIISASKISLFLHCPRKYELTYEYGYGELTKFFRNVQDLEFNYKEDEVNISGNIGGKIAHAVLEKNVSKNQIEKEIKLLVGKEEETLLFSSEIIDKLVIDISILIETFYNSSTFNRLNKYSNFKNEVEFYKRENDYFLYGIIDKLIIEDEKLIIIDYKSDKISKVNMNDKSKTYFNQLLFYAYVIISKYPKVKNVELLLVFLRDDKFTVSKNVNRNEVIMFGQIINSSVNKIRNKNFTDVLDGCKDMSNYLLDESV